MNAQRSIPSVEKLLQALGDSALPRPVVLALIRRQLADLRAEKRSVEFDLLLQEIRAALDDLRLTRIQPVINGTGIIIHTNLGRAPLGPAAVESLRAVASGYSNLEFDLASGSRGARAHYLEHSLALVSGAEAATVVNNCAAALVLILRHFTRKKPEVIISRGELIQIGGGFRIPEIMEASGARLREVGTTNRTVLDDYAQAIGPETAMILKVHRSNFFMTGFVESAGTAELGRLARAKKVPFVEDLGSGALIATDPPEPTPAEMLKRGADLVCFSADKLMGGPQAGIIAGKARLVAALKREPFFRALRCDKLVLSALQATVEAYLSGAEKTLPVHEMIALTNEQLTARAESIAAAAGPHVAIGRGQSQIGGGTMPQVTIPSVTLELPESWSTRLRRRTPAIVGYIERGKLKLDLRTIFPTQDEEIVRALRA